MRPFDPDGGDDPNVWRAEFAEWKAAVAAARRAQVSALTALNSAAHTLSQIGAWRDALAALLAAMSARVGPYAAADASLAELAAALRRTQDELDDHLQARDVATARLIAGPPVAEPVVLLPVRVHTAWLDGGLAVRVVPSELSVDRHDPRLSSLELTLGRAYRVTHDLPGDAQADQAWRDLTQRLPAPRAAWVARSTDPSAAAPPAVRDDELDLAVTVRLLPDRFAVVLLSGGEPVDVAAPGDPPTYVTWGSPVPRDLPVPVLYAPEDRPWITDLSAAVAAGLAVQIALPAGVTAVDEIVVVGLRSGSTGTDLGDLVAAHAYSVGTELVGAGTPTNNTGTGQTPRTAERERDLALALLAAPSAPPPGSAGATLATVLGIPAATVGLVGGSRTPRDDLYDAVAALVAATARGSLTTDAAGIPTAAPEAVAALRPAGPAPALRVGAQPFGVLPAMDAARYVAGPDAIDAALATVIRVASRRQLVPLDIDPADPVGPVPVPHRVTATDDSALTQILAETATSIRWSVTRLSTQDDPPMPVVGEAGLIGPPDGPGAPQSYLAALLADPADPAARAAAVESVLGAMAVTVAPTPVGPALLDRLTGVLGEHGRSALATALATHLDAVSHRVDAWVTAAATRRLADVPGGRVVGAYGYATDLAPRQTPRSFGHIHAPSLAHGATAAVLRSGYLGQRRAAWAERIEVALAAGDEAAVGAARTGLASLTPLDDRTEQRLPLAIDLTSTRVRRARAVLAAVRAGQPLAVVLGRQVERALVIGGLSSYLAPLRKLTRFRAGTALEGLEQARHDAGEALAVEQATVDELGAQAAAADAADRAAQATLAAAQAAFDALTRVFAPYAALDTERPHVQAALDRALARAADLHANRPAATSHHHRVDVP